MSRVRFNDLEIRDPELAGAVERAMSRVVASSWFVLGPEVQAFEEEFAAALGGGLGIGVASGTDALSLALAALGVGTGDEVLTSPLTATFTALAITRIGATPVFADVEESTLTLSAASCAERLTPRTKAVVPVHLYGNACDVRAIAAFADEHGLAVVEDACQAHGRPVTRDARWGRSAAPEPSASIRRRTWAPSVMEASS